MGRDLLELGLNALANTHKEFPGRWFHGHHGASVLAVYFIRDAFALEPEADASAEAFARSTVATVPDLFASPQAQVGASNHGEGVVPVVDTLERHIGQLTADGHDVIFASLAVKAFRARPSLITPERIAGVVALLEDAQNDDPTRYYGFADYLNDPVDYSDVPVFANVQQAANAVLADRAPIFPDQVIDGKLYYLAGNRLHDITHVHALVELHSMGYRALAARGLEPLRKQLHLCAGARFPADLVPFETSDVHDPWTAAFWDRDKRDAHQAKLAYAVMSLLNGRCESERAAALRIASNYWALLP